MIASMLSLVNKGILDKIRDSFIVLQKNITETVNKEIRKSEV